MKSGRHSFGHEIVPPFLAIVVAIICFGFSSGVLMAQDEAAEREFEDFDHTNFGERSTNIDNEWLPLKPGAQWIFAGVSVEGDKREPHRIEYTVSDLTKVIDGVRTVVIWLVDYSDGELVEKEIAFFAQGNDGSVWYFGEHPEEYEDGEFVEAPTWIAGIEDAKAAWPCKQNRTPGRPVTPRAGRLRSIGQTVRKWARWGGKSAAL